jgi:hypothetical protein
MNTLTHENVCIILTQFCWALCKLLRDRLQKTFAGQTVLRAVCVIPQFGTNLSLLETFYLENCLVHEKYTTFCVYLSCVTRNGP